jgi:hypothetical protein
LVLFISSILAIVASALLTIFTMHRNIGVAVAFVGIAGELVSLLSFLSYSRASAESDRDIKELNTVATIRLATLCVEQITDADRKNEAIERILRNILDIQPALKA